MLRCVTSTWQDGLVVAMRDISSLEDVNCELSTAEFAAGKSNVFILRPSTSDDDGWCNESGGLGCWGL